MVSAVAVVAAGSPSLEVGSIARGTGACGARLAAAGRVHASHPTSASTKRRVRSGETRRAPATTMVIAADHPQ